MQPSAKLQNELASYFAKGRLLKFDKGEFVLRACEEPKGAYMIQRGFIKVYSIADDGRENIHLIYKPGEVFPLIWVFKGVVRNIFYQAISPSRLWLMPAEELTELVSQSHTASQAMILQLTNQFHIYARRLDNLQHVKSMDRVVFRLLFMAERFGERDGRQIIINAPMTHQIFADTINLVRETVSRQLEELEKQKLITHKGRKIVIKDVEKLRSMISSPPDMWPDTKNQPPNG
ncbi:MAG TPA: Crp/Fnr family transcriptional regulator [Candidatus Saccharimonadales bacterium]|nr:Crp/Fnr family transcriptional regulator [Candidatus Saccharimonadales bacterium]